ncbi:Guanylate cyclase soluble subunit beta-1 [Holothuria leucospilota]|uniref:Guanylate cyclase soluble subunit beta-1 n=1 Tax=Holothuria leucospilota TaxID=206669 RepID=A0A9Q1BJY7_HOLLE|nr:Guanylate cyclase soluble subunit beta-1 [Holothuria leucospilota]
MYGFVNHALELLVLRNFGEEKWEEIKKEATVDIEGNFLVRVVYDDVLSYDLVAAASKVLGLSVNFLLEAFGKMFFEFCQESGYDKILGVLGSNTRDFLQNLDALHDHLMSIYPGMRAPSFRCSTRQSDGALVLHYYSERPGLEYIVVGLIKAVSSHFHSGEVEVEILRGKDDAHDHVQFAIIQKEEEKDSTEQSYNEVLSLPPVPRISPATFCSIFPFHMMFDENMNIHQSGNSVRRVIPAVGSGKCKITDVFHMVRPHMEFTFQSILSHINTMFVLHTRSTIYRKTRDKSNRYQPLALKLKGQMLHIQDSNEIAFLCSPSVTNLDELRKCELYLSDIPVHDATRDLVLISEKFEAEYKLTKKLEILTEKLQQTYRELENEKQKTDKLLYSVLPASVANELRHRRPVPAKKFEKVTLMFSGIAGFAGFCKKNSTDPLKIVSLLNELYTKFDDVETRYPDVYKVETVGDKYMAVSGLPEICASHARWIAKMALDMKDVSRGIIMGDEPIVVSIGIHSGEVVTGVVGHRMPRYCLFGNTVNISSRTETTGIKGKINVSQYAHAFLQDEDNFDKSFHFEHRGPVVMKGKKEPMQCYILTRNPEE